jgi:hypothetical protein
MSRKVGSLKINALTKRPKKVPKVDKRLDTIARKLGVDLDFVFQSLFSGYTYDQLRFTKELAVKAHEYFVQVAILNGLRGELDELVEKYFWSFYPSKVKAKELLGKSSTPKTKAGKVAKRGRGRPVGSVNKTTSKKIKKSRNKSK